jgi:hypothetical protein
MLFAQLTHAVGFLASISYNRELAEYVHQDFLCDYSRTYKGGFAYPRKKVQSRITPSKGLGSDPDFSQFPE